MLFFCLMWSFCSLFSARKRKLVLNFLLILNFKFIFSHTQNTALWEKSLPLKTKTQVHFGISSRHFTDARDTQKHNIQNSKCHHSSTRLQLHSRKKTRLIVTIDISQNRVILSKNILAWWDKMDCILKSAQKSDLKKISHVKQLLVL